MTFHGEYWYGYGRRADLPNRAWRSNLRALRDDWVAGEISDEVFFEAVIEDARPDTVRGVLGAIGERAAGAFDHWLTALHGNRIDLSHRLQGRRWGWRDDDHVEWKRRQRTIEAFQRLVLERREFE